MTMTQVGLFQRRPEEGAGVEGHRREETPTSRRSTQHVSAIPALNLHRRLACRNMPIGNSFYDRPMIDRLPDNDNALTHVDNGETKNMHHM